MTSNDLFGKFEPAVVRKDIDQGESWVFVVDKSSLLVKMEGDTARLPFVTELGLEKTMDEMVYLGRYESKHCYYINHDEERSVPLGMKFENLRVLFSIFDSELSAVAGRAVHLANWSRLNRYCGACGSKTIRKQDERAMQCSECGHVVYPRISPAIIIAIVKGDKLLLAHNRNFPGRRFSVIAGFMEPGETFEECAKREAFEEVGVRIKNIRFFGNQPWPFPDSLMIGLTAEYDSGEITPDGVEIDEAAWFGCDELPEIPGTISIAGRLIQWFSSRNPLE